PKDRLYSQLALRLNQHAKVVTQKFAQNLIFHGRVRLAANVVAELGLYHAKRRFDVGPGVIVPQELVALELVIAVHLLPQATRLARRAVGLKRNVRRAAYAIQQFQVFLAQIALVRRHFLDREVLGRGFDQRLELRAVVG